jgi:hypothetical protein
MQHWLSGAGSKVYLPVVFDGSEKVLIELCLYENINSHV